MTTTHPTGTRPPRATGEGRGGAALAYAARGWPVLPVWPPDPARGCACACGDPACGNTGKHPLGRLVHHGVLDATTDPAIIARWWRRFPGANVGIATGAVSGLVVLDIDARHDGARHLEQLERRFLPLPRTVEVITGGGGRHRYFTIGRRGPATDPAGTDDATIPTCANLRPGIDVRGEGGYVVAPPSLHASGRRYRWAPDRAPGDVAVAALPPWLAELARDHAEPVDVTRTRALRAGPLLPADPVDQETFRALMAEAGITPGGHEQEMHRCPWHPDEHPSLSVHWTAAVFHCFGCEVGGGIGTLRRLIGNQRQAAGMAWPSGDRWPW